MLAGKIAMVVVCLLGIVSLKADDYRPTVFLFKLAGIILLSVLWSYIIEEFISQRKKKRNAV